MFPSHKVDFRPRNVLLFPELYQSSQLLGQVSKSALIMYSPQQWLKKATLVKLYKCVPLYTFCIAHIILYNIWHPNQYLSNWNPPGPKLWLSDCPPPDLRSLTPIAKESHIQSQMIDFVELNNNQSAKIYPPPYKLSSPLSFSPSEILLSFTL